MKRWLIPVIVGWIVAVTVLHLWLNPERRHRGEDGLAFRVGFLPVT